MRQREVRLAAVGSRGKRRSAAGVRPRELAMGMAPGRWLAPRPRRWLLYGTVRKAMIAGARRSRDGSGLARCRSSQSWGRWTTNYTCAGTRSQ